MNLPVDITNLILTYATEPVYWFPDWVESKYHEKLLYYSGSNPRATRYILRTPPEKITEKFVRIIASNPAPAIIPLIVQGIEKFPGIDIAHSLMKNPTHDTKFIDFICEYMDGYLLTEPFVKSDSETDSKSSYSPFLSFMEKHPWLSLFPIAKTAGVKWIKTKLDEIINSKLGFYLCKIPDDYIIQKVYEMTPDGMDWYAIAENPTIQALKLLDMHPYRIDKSCIQFNPSQIIVDMMETLIKGQDHNLDENREFSNIYKKIREISDSDSWNAQSLCTNPNPSIVRILKHRPKLIREFLCSGKNWANQLDIKLDWASTIGIREEWIMEVYKENPTKFAYPEDWLSDCRGKINIYELANRNIYLMGKNKYANRLIKKLKLSNN